MGKVGVLMIHGTLGSPREFSPLIRHLNAQGIMTHAIVLPGHGASADRHLHEVTADEIIDHCRDAYLKFEKQCDTVYLVGQSLGGLCSLVLASERPQKLGGMVSLAAPYEYAYFVNYGHGLLRFPFLSIPLGLLYAPESFAALDYPTLLPLLHPIIYRESALLFELLQASLPEIDVPVLLVHSPYDLIVPYEEMQKIYQRINKPSLVTMETFERCGHQIFPSSRETRRAIQSIYQFIEQVESFQEKVVS